MRYSVASALALTMMVRAAPSMEQRDPPELTKVYETFEADEPNPYQIYFYKQITENHQCGDSSGVAECGVTDEYAESYGVSWGADISGAGWVSGNFAVSKEVSTGTSKDCSNKIQDGEGEDQPLAEWVCMWKRVPHTEYTVQDWWSWSKTEQWNEESEEYQMWSPNDESEYETVCAWDGDCEELGAEWWGPSRTAGGPTPYNFDDKWQ